MRFEGFGQQDFEIFEIPGYPARMPRVRGEITPKLRVLGELIAPRLRTATGLDFHPHVALHMRRTVNPPDETWVAFGRSPRAYKPFVHTRLAINKDGIKIVCFVEDDADDKETFAGNLKRNADSTARYLAANPSIHSYDLRDESGLPRPGSALDKKALASFAERLKAVRGQHVQFAIPIGRRDQAVGSRDSLVAAAVESMQKLLPLYRLGVERDARI